MRAWLKRAWYWILGALGAIGALWALLRPKPRPRPVPKVSPKERASAHSEIEEKKEEKIEQANDITEEEIKHALDVFDDTD